MCMNVIKNYNNHCTYNASGDGGGGGGGIRGPFVVFGACNTSWDWYRAIFGLFPLPGLYTYLFYH